MADGSPFASTSRSTSSCRAHWPTRSTRPLFERDPLDEPSAMWTLILEPSLQCTGRGERAHRPGRRQLSERSPPSTPPEAPSPARPLARPAPLQGRSKRAPRRPIPPIGFGGGRPSPVRSLGGLFAAARWAWTRPFARFGRPPDNQRARQPQPDLLPLSERFSAGKRVLASPAEA